MFRERPLTWLFLLATIVVDLAMVFSRLGPIFNGILVGQVAAVSVWAALGPSHRLFRGSLLVLAIGLLATLPGQGSFNVYSRSLTFMAAYGLIVVLTSLVFIWLRKRVRGRFKSEREQTPLKVPLIEFFGWTLVAAIASFGTRYMNVQSLERVQRHLPQYLLIYAMVPLALILFTSRFRILHLVKAALFIYSVYWFGSNFLGGGSRYGLSMTSLAAYLTAWLLVRSIEYDQLRTAEENEENEDEDSDVKLLDADK